MLSVASRRNQDRSKIDTLAGPCTFRRVQSIQQDDNAVRNVS